MLLIVGLGLLVAPFASSDSSATCTLAPSIHEIWIEARDYDFWPGEFQVEQGERVIVHLLATDRSYSFEILQWGIKISLQKAKQVTVEFIADKLGEFEFTCGKPCGSKGELMFGTLTVVPPLPDAGGGVNVVDTTICDILESPTQFDGRMVRVRGQIEEFFEVSAVRAQCGSIWLDFGETGAPTTMVSMRPRCVEKDAGSTRPSVTLRRDRYYDLLAHYLNEEVKPKRKRELCISCTRYEVEATITGRVDSVEKTGIVRDESGKVTCIQGFGHLNAYPVRLVLESVRDIAATEREWSVDYEKVW